MIIYYEYNIETIFLELLNFFCIFFAIFSVIHRILCTGSKDERRRRVSEKNGGTVITSAGGINSPAKYKDISHENEERRV